MSQPTVTHAFPLTLAPYRSLVRGPRRTERVPRRQARIHLDEHRPGSAEDEIDAEVPLEAREGLLKMVRHFEGRGPARVVDAHRPPTIAEAAPGADVLGVEREGQDAPSIGEAAEAGGGSRDVFLDEETLTPCRPLQASQGWRDFRRTSNQGNPFAPSPVHRFHHCGVAKGSYPMGRLVVEANPAGARGWKSAKAKSGIGHGLVSRRRHRFAA